MAYNHNNDWRTKSITEFVDKINEHDPNCSIIYITVMGHAYTCMVKKTGKAMFISANNTLCIETDWLIDRGDEREWEPPKVYRNYTLRVNTNQIVFCNIIEEITEFTATKVLATLTKEIDRTVKEYNELKETYNLCRNIFKLF